MYMQQVLAVVLMAVALFPSLTSCHSHSQSKNRSTDAYSRKLMMDPTANYEWFVKVDDMTLVKKEFREKLEHGNREKRATLKHALLWENGMIPYVFTGVYRDDEIAKITRAMAHYEEHTCLRFKPRTDEPHFIAFYKGAGCQSFIGRVGGMQGVSLTSNCIRAFSTIVHEIGHAIGLIHEQSRPDRDMYIDVLYENVYTGFERQFARHDEDDVDTLGIGYDYNSVMHYDHDAFSKTIMSLPSWLKMIPALKLVLRQN